MNLLATIEEFETFHNVTFYTIRLESNGVVHDESETDKFFRKFLIDVKPPLFEAEIIYKMIEKIGNRGALEKYFRFENRAEALPPKNKFIKELLLFSDEPSVNLRLYCIRITENIVILLNGGIKTSNQVQNCPNVSPHFNNANKIAKLIDDEIRLRGLKIRGNFLEFDDDLFLQLI